MAYRARSFDTRPSQWDRRLYTNRTSLIVGIGAAFEFAVSYALHYPFAYTLGVIIFAVSLAVELWSRRGSVALRAVLVVITLGWTAFLLTHPHDAWLWMEDIVRWIGKETTPAQRHLAHGSRTGGHR